MGNGATITVAHAVRGDGTASDTPGSPTARGTSPSCWPPRAMTLRAGKVRRPLVPESRAPCTLLETPTTVAQGVLRDLILGGAPYGPRTPRPRESVRNQWRSLVSSAAIPYGYAIPHALFLDERKSGGRRRGSTQCRWVPYTWPHDTPHMRASRLAVIGRRSHTPRRLRTRSATAQQTRHGRRYPAPRSVCVLFLLLGIPVVGVGVRR